MLRMRDTSVLGGICTRKGAGWGGDGVGVMGLRVLRSGRHVLAQEAGRAGVLWDVYAFLAFTPHAGVVRRSWAQAGPNLGGGRAGPQRVWYFFVLVYISFMRSTLPVLFVAMLCTNSYQLLQMSTAEALPYPGHLAPCTAIDHGCGLVVQGT